MNAVAKIETKAVVPRTDSAALLAVIERAASNPDVNIDKMERLWAMHQQSVARNAKAAYAAALAEMQDELPAVAERGNAAGRYTYALWEDINAAIKPVLKRHGFALSFRTDFADGIAVTGVLSHREGHEEQTTIKLPADGSGNKNAVQAVASSVSYGKRYAAGALLNLTSHGEDDDAYAAAVAAPDPAWFDALNGATDDAALRKVKADMVKEWGSATKVPKDLIKAYNARLDELRGAKQP